MGYKSVAHYLIQTRRSQTNLEKDPENENQISAKRPLLFPNKSEESLQAGENLLGTASLLAEDSKKEDDVNVEKHNKMQSSLISAKRSLPFLDSEEESLKDSVSEFQEEDNAYEGIKGEQERKLHTTDEDNDTNNIALKNCTKPKRKHDAIEPSLDSIDGRFNSCEEMDSTAVNRKILDVNQAVNNILSEEELEKQKEMQIDGNHGSPKLKSKPVESEDRDCVWLPDVNDKSSNIKSAVNDILSEKEGEINTKKAKSRAPIADSIAGRLRSRIKAE